MEQIKSIGTLLERYDEQKEKKPSHEKAASVNEIIKVVGNSNLYNYGYWLRKIGSASFSTVLEICKKAADLEAKYSKGGFITNQLKPYAIKSKRPRTNGRGAAGPSKKEPSKQGSGSGRKKEVPGKQGTDNRQSSLPEMDDSKRSVDSDTERRAGGSVET